MKKQKHQNSKKNIFKIKTSQQKITSQPPNPVSEAYSKILLILLLTVIVYIPSMNGSFVWDGDHVIKDNLLLRTTDGLWKIWFAPFSNIEEVHYWPLVYTVFWIEYQLWNLNALGYHLVNVFFHSLNTFLLWIILTRLSISGSFLAAAIFALHPVHVESVAWSVELKDVLSGMFYLLAFLTYLQFNTRKDCCMYVLSLFLFVCALLSKSITITFPILLVLYLWWKNELERKNILPLIPFFIVAIAMGIGDVLFVKQHQRDSLNLTYLDRFLIAGRALWFYAEKIFLPINLIGIYPKWAVNTKSIIQYLFPLSIIALIVLLWFKRQRFGKGPLILVLYFIITLTPVLGFITHCFMFYSYIADRFQYLASIGLIILFSAGAVKIVKRAGAAQKIVKCGGGAFLFLFLGAATWYQNTFYVDMEAFFRNIVTKNPQSSDGFYNLGYALGEKGKIDEAIASYEKALKIRTDSVGVHNNLGVALAKKGRLEEAVPHFLEAIRLKPDDYLVQNNFGMSLVENKKFEEAIPYYEEALRLCPGFADGHNNLGIALAETGDVNKAVFHFKKSLDLKPNEAKVLYNLAGALTTMGKYEEAKPYLLKALELEPTHVSAHVNLGMVLAHLGEIEEAISEYRKALELDPNMYLAMKKLAWLLATSKDPKLRNGEEAVKLATIVNEKTENKVPKVLDTLAAAYAEIGNFEEAKQLAQRAFATANQFGSQDLAGNIQKRIQLYNQKNPYRE